MADRLNIPTLPGNEPKKTRLRTAMWTMVAVAGGLLCLSSAATQFIAWQLDYDSALGSGLVGDYYISGHGSMTDVLTRIASHPAHRLDELLPWNWKTPAVAIAAQAA